MSALRPAASTDAGQWLVESGADWWDLVRYGPPGFDEYVRVALARATDDLDHDQSAVRLALAVLAAHTATPTAGYAAVWEGWTSRGPTPRAPRLPIPQRAMLLFTGPVDVLRDAATLAWYGSVRGCQEPHLVWPDDHAWCLACEVDEEIEFTVGCSVDASRALADVLPGAVRRVRYGEPAPL
jgi:hypothetical protein